MIKIIITITLIAVAFISLIVWVLPWGYWISWIGIVLISVIWILSMVAILFICEVVKYMKVPAKYLFQIIGIAMEEYYKNPIDFLFNQEILKQRIDEKINELY